MNDLNLKSRIFVVILCSMCIFAVVAGVLLLNNQSVLKHSLNYIAEIKHIPLETTVDGLAKEHTWSAILKGYAKKFVAIGILGLMFCSIAAWLSKDKINKMLSMRIFRPLPKVAKYSLSITALLFVFLFIFSISYYRQPLGDDVLFQFTKGYNMYLDNNNGEIGQQITNLPLLMESLKGVYAYHSGRIIGFALIPLLSIFGQTFTAALTGLSFAFLILLAAAMIFDNFNESLKHPLILLSLFLIIFYFNPGVGFLSMWTFTSIYVVSLILLGIYYCVYRITLICGKQPIAPLPLIGFNALGFFAGLIHQIYGLVFLILVGVLALKEILRNQAPLKRLFRHSGLLLGTIICLIAPGNYVRLINSHDSILMARPFLEKMQGVFATNVRMLAGIDYSSLLVMIIILFAAALSSRYAYSKTASITRGTKFFWGMHFFKKNAIDIFFLFTITTAWSLVSNMWLYGALLFILWFAVVIFKNAVVYWLECDKNLLLRVENSYAGAFLAIILIFSISILNFNWMYSMAKTTIERKYLITRAIRDKRLSVEVPRYDDICTNRFTIFTSARENYNNFVGNNNGNESIFYNRYYGIKMYTSEKEFK